MKPKLVNDNESSVQSVSEIRRKIKPPNNKKTPATPVAPLYPIRDVV